MTICPSLDLDPFDEAFLVDPFAYHDQIRDAGPVVWLDSIGCYAMARFAEVQAALKDHGTFCSGRGVGLADFAREQPFRPPSLLLESDPPLHDRARAIMNRIVSLKALKLLRAEWRSIAENLVDELVSRRQFDAVTDLAEEFPMRVFPDIIGVPVEGRKQLLEYATIVFNGFGPRNAVFEHGNQGKEAAIDWVTAACKRENLLPGGWGMAIYDAADRGECTEDEAGRLVRSFLSAGVDTTVNGIAHMILAFARFPSEFSRLRANRGLALQAFEESLRWDSTVQTFFRTTTCDTAVSGTHIPKGSKVLLMLAAANRDPRQWEVPEQFVLNRRISGHVGFGFGIHQCLGQMVARLEGEIIATAIAERVTEIRLINEPVRRLNNTLHAISHLPVEVDAVAKV
ncbi:cytochrome P450 [Parasphingorhabdus sp.]|uniref:cytochrome P450 n=1 Tax=Parasphingorhabdus sp. TaxID=2709688 RepID=UPI0032EC9C12